MPAPPLNDALRADYSNMFTGCTPSEAHKGEISQMVNKIAQNKSRYQTVASQLNIPWYFIALVHAMEGGLNFNTHLHNGDPLTGRTVQVPADRPAEGNPPFTWEESALDSLKVVQKVDQIRDWSVPHLLYTIEGYNGYGYRGIAPPIHSPYLWSYSQWYTKGKFVGDHKYDPDVVSKQCGAAVLLRALISAKVVEADANGAPVFQGAAAASSGQG